jgi:hypothetical protein
MTDTLVNSIYPVSYFSLPGVDEIQYPDTFWWSSKIRFAALDFTGTDYQSVADGGARTSEILEIDLGRIREINYINMDVLRAPIDIRIEYDIISSPDRDSVWVPISPTANLPYDDRITFDAGIRTSWFNGEYNFTDPKGDMVHARYLRITFTRRDEPFPTKSSGPFEWAVMVKHLRLGRYIADHIDTVGPLLVQDTPAEITPTDLAITGVSSTREARQEFIIPKASVRAGETPNILGFGILIKTADLPAEAVPQDLTQEVSFAWSLWDVTSDSSPLQVRSGIASGAIVGGLSWLDFYLDEASILTGDPNIVGGAYGSGIFGARPYGQGSTDRYELRVSSLNPLVADTVFMHSPNTLSNFAIPGTLTFSNGSTTINTSVDVSSVVRTNDYIVRADIPDQVYTVNAIDATTITINVPFPGPDGDATGLIVFPSSQYDPNAADYVFDGSKNMVMRVWADIGDEGRDVLGNAYRYVNRRQLASYVADDSKAGWMSKALPTPDAVEALYFDVRTTDALGKPALNLIEAIQIAPRTPGVRMNVYYSQQGIGGETPETTNDWDYLLWEPVQVTYVLRRNEVIQLPQAIRAAYVKLEFTALNPLPFNLPTFPRLPPVVYRRFPTWVEDQFNNAQVRTLVEDWFLRNATPVETKILQGLSDPVQEFAYKQREFLGQLALGAITDAQVVNSGLVDIADRALIDPVTATKIYISTSTQYQNSLVLSVDPSSVLGQAVINRFDPTVISAPIEAVADSVVVDQIPVVSTTNDRISESYQNIAQIPMRFNQTCRHEYTIEEAEFNKKAFFVGIQEVAFLRNDYRVEHDDEMISDILHDDEMLVEDTFVREEGTQIPDNTTLYVSYQINPDVFDEPVFLSGFTPVSLAVTGAPARNVLVFSMQKKQGIQYLQNMDYELTYITDENGVRVNQIARSSLGARLVVPKKPVIYVDAGTVISHAIIPSPPTYDASTVISGAIIDDGYSVITETFITDPGTGITTPVIVYTVPDPDPDNPWQPNDHLSNISGPFRPDYGTGTYGGVGNVVAGTYGDLRSLNDDASTAVGVANPSGPDSHLTTDNDTVMGVAVPSATGSYTDGHGGGGSDPSNP